MPQVDHFNIVKALHVEHPPERTVEGALAFLLRLVAQLPAHERAGLLLKPAGENIVNFKGQMVSAGRICYPDGLIVKVLIDVPSTNGPGWAPDDPVDPGRYLAVSHVPPPPPPPPPPDDVLARLDAVLELQRQHTQTLMGLAGVVAALAEKKHPILRATDDAKLFGMTIFRKGQAVLGPEG